MRVEPARALVALAEELNFRRAAARLFVSQPALTAQLHPLERDLGVTLFDRGPGGRPDRAGRPLAGRHRGASGIRRGGTAARGPCLGTAAGGRARGMAAR